MTNKPNHRQVMRSLMIEYLFEPWDRYTKTLVELAFRQQCPGNYTIAWDDNMIGYSGLDVTRDYFRLEFANEQEEIIWRLTYE